MQQAKLIDLDTVGIDWLEEEAANLTEYIKKLKPSEYNEQVRYLPKSVTSMAGFIRYAVTPYLREIVDCADVNSPVREVNVMKGAQVGFSVCLESILLYYADYIGTAAMILLTADREMATQRIESNILPAIHESGLSHIIQSSDITASSKKTGINKQMIQFKGGGYVIPLGAQSANKFRSISAQVLFKDETSAYPATMKGEGCPDKISDSRVAAFPHTSKIYRGSTPAMLANSIINRNFLKGDQRRWFVPCRGCGLMQFLQWRHVDKETGNISGFTWTYHDDETLNLDSVGYECIECNFKHYEKDKEWLFSRGEWRPTAKAIQPTIRSYHIPSFVSPIGMQPWSSAVLAFLDSYNPETNTVKDINLYQTFVNVHLGMPFEARGRKVSFEDVNAHRRTSYGKGDIPNLYALKHTNSPILFLTLSVDVHKAFLAICVIGWTVDQRSFVIDYDQYRDADCTRTDSPVWSQVKELIENKTYKADDGQDYNILMTFIDSGYESSLVVGFCSDYASGVYPVVGRDTPSKTNTLNEFSKFITKVGTEGYRITVDYYKNRLSAVLRENWQDDQDILQPRYLFNAPSDLSDEHLKELTVESRRSRTDSSGVITYYWNRPSNVRNELWDCLVYGHAAVEVLAWNICIQHFELETVNWPDFWAFALDPANDNVFARVPKPEKANLKQ